MEDHPSGQVLDDSLQQRLDELLQRASKDSLSGLLNRATMEAHIRSRIDKMKSGESCALFIIDLDSFKLVNDTLGHQAGDSAIGEVARTLSSIFRASDIVGRLGGDEFAVFMSGAIDEDLVRSRGARICSALHMGLGKMRDLELTASVGIALSNGPRKFEVLYSQADAALYKAKKSGKNGFCLTTDEGVGVGSGEDLQIFNAIPMDRLLEGMDSGIALVEIASEARVIYVSQSLCRMLGIELKDAGLPASLRDRIHPDDLPTALELLHTGAVSSSPVEMTLRVAGPGNGSWRWWKARASRIGHGDIPHPVMLVTTNDITAYKQTELQLEDSNERLRTAFAQTSQRLWEVDIRNRTYTTYRKTGDSDQEGDGQWHPFPGHLVDMGIVHPGSVDRFRLFADAILSGQGQGYGNFIMRYPESGCYGWVSLSYRTIYDDVGHAARAIGISDDISASFCGQSPDSIPQRLLPEALLYGLLVRMRLNLSQDLVEELWFEGRDMLAHLQKEGCLAVFERIRSDLSPMSDGDLLDLTPQQLTGMFHQGRRWLYGEGMRTDGGGTIRRVRQVWHLVESALTHDVYLNAYMLQVELPDDWDQALGPDMERDALSGLYGRDAIERYADKVFANPATVLRGLAIFQINGLAGQGEEAQKNLLYALGALLSMALGGDCVLGQYGIERIIVLFPSLASRDELKHRMEEAFSMIRRVLRSGTLPDSMRFVAGLAVQEPSGLGYAQMLTSASYACSKRWNSPVDTVAFADDADDRTWNMIQTLKADDQVAVLPPDRSRPLTDGEKEVAFNCMSAMLSAQTLDDSICGVLRNLGIYYQADRVYILTIASDRRIVTMPFEWDDPCKCSIQQVVSGMLLDNFPLLKRCSAENAPVFLERHQESRRGSHDKDRRDESWRFSTFPLMRNDHMEGFLCIENARRYPTSAALFSTLIPYLMHEQERFSSKARSAGTVEQLMGLPDLRSFMDTIYTLDSRKYTSLGAVCLDIPGMAAINSSQGFEYGNRLLWYVSKTLTDIFGPSLLFRTWEAEFIAFCPNTTRQVFQGRCARLRSIVQRRYPKDVRIGAAWADGSFTGRHLVDESRQNMHTETGGVHLSTPPILRAMDEHIGEDGRMDAHPVVYFQPIVDMRTGQVFAAEALVRGLDDSGQVIPPSRFIDTLEKDGSIRELDLFVLDSALAQVDRWRAEGMGILRVSVNLSRITLLYPSTLASILAIQSRYPKLPASTLELEITENSDVMGNGEFQDIVEKLRSYGLRVSLDDFGSHYANLSLFANVRFDTVKLDRSLIATLGDKEVGRMLVKDLVGICHANRMICVAEGVEREDQIALLLDAGCAYAQGYYYDRPLSAQDFERRYMDSTLAPMPAMSAQDMMACSKEEH